MNSHRKTEATRIIARIAASQYGVFSRRQVLAEGVSSGLIAGRVDSGWLTPIFVSVYSPGIGILDYRGRWMAAVLAAGPGAVLSHYSAAAHHGFIERRSRAIEVTRTSGDLRQIESLPSAGSHPFSVVIHRMRALPDRDVTAPEGIPVTSVSRAFLDIAPSMSVDQLKTALSEAEKMRLLSLPDLREVLSRGKGWFGTRKLGRALAEWDPLEADTRSDLEIAMLRLCRREGIPVPIVNAMLGDYMPDFMWRGSGLIIEVDGYRDHGGRQAFRRDRRRDVDLTLAGFRVARFTHDEVMLGSDETARLLRGLLDLGPPTGSRPSPGSVPDFSAISEISGTE